MSRKSIEAQLQEIKDDMCDEYCRWPLAYRLDYEDSEEAYDALLKEKCADCPLMRI